MDKATEVTQKKQINDQKVAAIVDDNGNLQGQFLGFGALQDAQATLRQCQQGGVRHLTRAQVVTGDEARKAIAKKRL
jgi:hypothetical protein